MAEQTKSACASNQVELPRGTVAACVPADRADLTELYRAAYPHSTLADLTEDLRDESLEKWVVYRDEQDRVRVAVYICANGMLCVLARPEECTSDEIMHGFLMLAQKAQEAFAPRGLWILHSATLQPLAKRLELGGFLSKEFSMIRSLHFDNSGTPVRAN